MESQRDRNLSNKMWFNPEDFVAQKVLHLLGLQLFMICLRLRVPKLTDDMCICVVLLHTDIKLAKMCCSESGQNTQTKIKS